MTQFSLFFLLSTSASCLQGLLLQDAENPNYNRAFITTYDEHIIIFQPTHMVRLLTFFLWATSLHTHLHKTLMWTF